MTFYNLLFFKVFENKNDLFHKILGLHKRCDPLFVCLFVCLFLRTAFRGRFISCNIKQRAPVNLDIPTSKNTFTVFQLSDVVREDIKMGSKNKVSLAKQYLHLIDQRSPNLLLNFDSRVTLYKFDQAYHQQAKP